MHSEPFSSGLHVIFGAGPVGLALAHELVTKGQPVRLVTRSGRGEPLAGVDRVAADASDPAQAATAAAGARVVYHAVGADYGRWGELLPLIMTGLIQAASSAG